MHVPRNAVLTNAVSSDIFNAGNLNIAQTFKDRMSDTYMVTELEYNNANNYRFICAGLEIDIRKVF